MRGLQLLHATTFPAIRCDSHPFADRGRVRDCTCCASIADPRSHISPICPRVSRRGRDTADSGAGIGAVSDGTPVATSTGVAATNSFRDLDVWHEAMTLVEEIYGVTKRFPADERFLLGSQLRRAAVSIPSNIAEGSRRKRRRANLYHLDVALGSQGEVEAQLEIAERLGYCPRNDARRVQ